MVKNNYSEDVKKSCNALLTSFFQMNLDCDNRAYALDTYLECPEAAKEYHEKYAHIWTSDVFADHWSEVLVKEGIVPHRSGLEDDGNQEYENIATLFEDNYADTLKMKLNVLSLIEVLEFEKDCKVLIIELENFAVKLSELVRQSDIWQMKANRYQADGKAYKFDEDFEDFTMI